MKTKMAVISLGFLCASGVNLSYAATVNLLGGVADPFNIGYVPVPPNEPIPFSPQDLLLMTDSSTSTGFTFTSHAGEYSSASYSVVGFGKRFDFDISGYSNIQQIDFTWTGRYTWDGRTFPSLRFGSDPAMPAAYVNFGTNSAPDNMIHTVTVSFLANSTNFNALANVIHGNAANIWVSTDLGFSTSDATITFASVQTLEVSANVVGTVVPIPATLPLLASGLGLVSLLGRRRNPSR